MIADADYVASASLPPKPYDVIPALVGAGVLAVMAVAIVAYAVGRRRAGKKSGERHCRMSGYAATIAT